MANHLSLPLVEHDHSSWGCINYFGSKQVICAESFSIKKEKNTFRGEHRVRLYAVEGNIYWRLPADVKIDIADVKPATVPQRRHGR